MMKNVNSANIQNHLDQSKLFSKYSHCNKGLDIGQKDGTQPCVMIRGYHQFSPMAETKTIVYCCNVASPADFSVVAFCFVFCLTFTHTFPRAIENTFLRAIENTFLRAIGEKVLSPAHCCRSS